MTFDRDAAVAELVALLGDAAVLGSPADLSGYERGTRYGAGRAACVARPRDAREVQQVIRWARKHELRLIAQGANTGLVAAASPDDTGNQVIVSFERMRHEIDLDVHNRTVRVGAGVLLQSLNDYLQPHGLCFPIDLGANPSIGGMIAANTGGARLMKYGDVRRNLLGLEVVLADEPATHLDFMSGLRKDNSGVDLKQLFVGTSGAFGFITSAILEVHPLPQQRACALLVPSTPERALDLLRAFELKCGELLTSFEAMSKAAMECVFRFRPQIRNPFGETVPELVILVELTSAMPASMGVDLESMLETVLTELAESDDATLADALLGRAEESWQLRHAISDSLREAGKVIAFDISVRRSSIQAFRDLMIQELKQRWPHLKVCDFGHLGDGGLHLNLVWPHDCGIEPDAAVIQEIRAFVYHVLVSQFQGSFSAEHGVGPYNSAIYQRYTASNQQHIAGSLQRLLNPDGALGTVKFGP
ncbi:FAD-binding oxidoreductase [Steroidobacter sp.]|uniref:FAD-binding oxidoreductase n=1 Tax=Steroidobacter sp. TaxID=1978227 RepID=UPI001A47469C|nr:FAD-binding oxidoreductase [Steroidobacter sp.]MBL8265169.1 FAD-binding oxidoreductase [Steroidobacter sp.]